MLEFDGEFEIDMLENKYPLCLLKRFGDLNGVLENIEDPHTRCVARNILIKIE